MSNRSPIYKYLIDGAAVEMNVNGAVTPVVYKLIPDNTKGVCFLARMIIHYGDTANFAAEEYGNIGSALSNGILICINKRSDDSVVLDLCDGQPIKSNSEWPKVCYDSDIIAFGAGEDYLKARWTFEKSGFPLHIAEDEYFSFTIQDDLTGLLNHTAMVHGYYIK